jgi:hypothetical protein
MISIVSLTAVPFWCRSVPLRGHAINGAYTKIRTDQHVDGVRKNQVLVICQLDKRQMILPEDDKKINHDSEALLASGRPFTSGASSSNTVSSPPLLTNDVLNSQLEAAENGHLLIDVGNTLPQNTDTLALGPPPEFTQYEAEHFEVGYSDVVSHDPHLNSDGMRLQYIYFFYSFFTKIYKAKLSIASSYLKLLLPLLIAFHVAVHTQKYVVDGSLEETTTVNHDLVKKHIPRPSQTLIFVSTFSLMVLLHLFNGLLRMMNRRTVVLWYASLKGQQAREGGLPQDRK